MKFLLFVLVCVGIAWLGWMICFGGIAPTKRAQLARRWMAQAHGLDEDEVVRLVTPPYWVGRTEQYLRFAWGAKPPLPPAAPGQLVYDLAADGPYIAIGASARGTVDSALRWCIGPYGPAIAPDIAPELRLLAVDGDWTIRRERPIERKMAALESILSQATRRRIAIVSQVDAAGRQVWCVRENMPSARPGDDR